MPLSDRFQNLETERRFRRSEREKLAPYVRAYAVIAALILLVYGTVNPLFFTQGDSATFSLLLGPTLLCLGAYFAVTRWSGYIDRPFIDFAFLLVLAILIALDNLLLFEELNMLDPHGHANIAINHLIVSAFAAVAMASQQGWFRLWLVFHAIIYAVIILLFEQTSAGRVYAAMSYATGAGVMLFLNWALGRALRRSFALGEELEGERAKTEELLFNVLPPAAARKIRAGQVVADSFSDASVVFVDIVNFTQLSKTISPGHLIDLLNTVFAAADRCADETGIEKIKTVGDAYIAISGGNIASENSAVQAITFAKQMLTAMPEIREQSGLAVFVRIGIHTGPVVGGVIGARRMAYDYWGETMNIASRMESVAEADQVAVSQSSFLRAKRAFDFHEPEELLLKGIGKVPVYRVKI